MQLSTVASYSNFSVSSLGWGEEDFLYYSKQFIVF